MGASASTGAGFHISPSAAASKFKVILDQYESIEDVQEGLKKSGLESSQLIMGIDFTQSNIWTGKLSFRGKCLHEFSEKEQNPYEQAMSVIARTLAAFDDDDLIPCYGFGDYTTGEDAVFSFFPEGRPANGLEDAVSQYRNIAQLVELGGPTSFAPLITKAMQDVIDSGMQYHILIIIADGQVSSCCQRATADAIVKASHLPLSIIMVGVGDGPWDQMEQYDDMLPQRLFDNFQFVPFAKIMEQASVYGQNSAKAEAHFAVHALMEIPEQYSIIQKLGLMTTPKSRSRAKSRVLPPPPAVMRSMTSS